MTDNDSLTYYNQPLLPQPVWKWMIPTYYVVGGISGAALVISAAAQIRGPFTGRSQLMRSCQWIAFGGSGVSAMLLVADLGRPERFINMLRVFRPTSPMNMGAWILSGVGVTTPGALMLQGKAGFLGMIGSACGLLAGFFGAGLATYTGVLASNSAIPLWQESRRMMPILFGASAMASVGSLLQITQGSNQGRAIATNFGRIGQLGELVAGALMERQASEVERVGRMRCIARRVRSGPQVTFEIRPRLRTPGRCVRLRRGSPGRGRCRSVSSVLGVSDGCEHEREPKRTSVDVGAERLRHGFLRLWLSSVSSRPTSSKSRS